MIETIAIDNVDTELLEDQIRNLGDLLYQLNCYKWGQLSKDDQDSMTDSLHGVINMLESWKDRSSTKAINATN